MENSHVNHPLDYGIEEIDLSQNFKYQNRNFYVPNDNIDEINLSSSIVRHETVPTTSFTRKTSNERPAVPERPRRKTDASLQPNEAKHFQSKPTKRIAPRILPKIPVNVNSNANLDSSKISQNNLHSQQEPIKSENEQSYYINIDHIGWYYKKDQISSDLKTQTSQSSNLDELNFMTEEKNLASTSPQVNEPGATNSNNTVSNKKWIQFNKHDTANLEQKHRQIFNEKKSTEPKLVQVLDDLYEVNLTTKKCYAIYWKGRRTFSVMRSIWFNENHEPFEEKSSEEIELKHIELFKDLMGKSFELESAMSSDAEQLRAEASSPTDEMKQKNFNEAPKALPEPMGSINIEEGVVTWYSKDEVYCEKNKMSLIEKVNFGFSKFRNKINGVRIKRGLKHKIKDTEQEDKPQEITHLIFVVHGIAQKMYENGIVKNCEDLRKECEKKKKEYFSTNKDHRYMFLPVDWRSSLTLDEGVVETITPNSIPLIREKLNSSALDIMYYTSPLFRIEILNSLSSELNRLYEIFCSKNTYFKRKYNKVSFAAHSLGTVIVYDILTSDHTCTQFSNTYGQVSEKEKEKFQRYSQNDSNLLNEYISCKNRIQEIENNLFKSNNNVTPLGFTTENFFSLGSPLAVFLAMRGVRPAGTGNQEHILPKHLCKHLYNIFHPSDPIAYRIEPLIIKNYSIKSPLEILKSDVMPKVTYRELNEKRAISNATSQESNKSVLSAARIGKGKKDKELDDSVAFNHTGISIQGQTSSPLIEQVELESALDFQLQDSNFELMATLRAHTCYWKSPDTALFILNQLITNDS